MGRASRNKPARLAEKLLAIRTSLGLSQSELIRRIETGEIRLYKSDISRFESGSNEPPLIIVLRYARLAGLTMETLVDDNTELPVGFTRQS